MYKKLASLFTLIFFIFFSFSCYSTKMRNIEKIKPGKKGSVKILEVFKKSGEKIKFKKSNPGIIQNDIIIGQAVDDSGKKEYVNIPISEVDKLLFKKPDVGKSMFLITAILATIFYVLLYVGFKLDLRYL